MVGNVYWQWRLFLNEDVGGLEALVASYYDAYGDGRRLQYAVVIEETEEQVLLAPALTMKTECREALEKKELGPQVVKWDNHGVVEPLPYMLRVRKMVLLMDRCFWRKKSRVRWQPIGVVV